MLAQDSRRAETPHILSFEYYERLHWLEERHWWAMGMRGIATRLIDPRFRGRSAIRILDAGCGTGGMLAWLERYADPRRIVGIDFSAYALDFCRQHQRWPLARASITAVPFSDGVFDLVNCTDVIQHLPRDGSDRQALQECRRVLRPGGTLFLRTNVRLGRSDEHPAEPTSASRDYHHYLPRELVSLLGGVGFRVDRVSYANMLPALGATLLRRLNPFAAVDDRPGVDRGLRMRIPPVWLNTVLRFVIEGEAWYLATHRPLPYGHSLLCLATKPEQADGLTISRGR